MESKIETAVSGKTAVSGMVYMNLVGQKQGGKRLLCLTVVTLLKNMCKQCVPGCPLKQAWVRGYSHKSMPGYEAIQTKAGLGTRLFKQKHAWVRGYSNKSRPGYEAIQTKAGLGIRLFKQKQAWVRGYSNKNRPGYEAIQTKVCGVFYKAAS